MQKASVDGVLDVQGEGRWKGGRWFNNKRNIIMEGRVAQLLIKHVRMTTEPGSIIWGLKAIGWRPMLLGWRPSLLGWRPLFLDALR